MADLLLDPDAYDRYSGPLTPDRRERIRRIKDGGHMPGSSVSFLLEMLDMVVFEHEGLVKAAGAANETAARFLAEAGAVHPKVHTPTRIINYLERHGWRRIESPKPQPGVLAAWPWWSPPDPDRIRWIHPSGIELDAPLVDDLPRYADVVRVVVNRIAWAVTGEILASDAVRSEVLLEVAQQPDEVAW